MRDIIFAFYCGSAYVLGREVILKHWDVRNVRFCVFLSLVWLISPVSVPLVLFLKWAYIEPEPPKQ